jgi:hypothetical protein
LWPYKVDESNKMAEPKELKQDPLYIIHIIYIMSHTADVVFVLYASSVALGGTSYTHCISLGPPNVMFKVVSYLHKSYVMSVRQIMQLFISPSSSNI